MYCIQVLLEQGSASLGGVNKWLSIPNGCRGFHGLYPSLDNGDHKNNVLDDWNGEKVIRLYHFYTDLEVTDVTP